MYVAGGIVFCLHNSKGSAAKNFLHEQQYCELCTLSGVLITRLQITVSHRTVVP